MWAAYENKEAKRLKEEEDRYIKKKKYQGTDVKHERLRK